ncbi:MAG TPA: nucleotidyltransferase family protein [Chryseosolibacter sp.]
MIPNAFQSAIISKLKELRPKKIGVFGSYARNENRPSSDLDILIYLEPNAKVSLLKLIAAEQELTDCLRVQVDLITERSLNPLIRPSVEKDLKIIFG